MFLRFFTAMAAAVTSVAPALATELIMVDQRGCHYCEQWTAEVGTEYPKTAEGKFAPLRRIDISERAPEGVSYARRVNFTPTFVLVDEAGTELGRIEGYPGEDFFWGLLEVLLVSNTSFEPAAGEVTSATPAPADN